jgi:Ca2+:H+ antiporter
LRGVGSDDVPRWLYALLAFGVLASVGRLAGWPPTLVFAAACLGLVPLAGLIGHATGQVALHLGAQYGGLLNATFGNAAELIITLLALRQGLFTLVKASITGSIVGNTLLVLGLALLAGGLRHGLLRFDLRVASLNSSLMILAVAGLLLPALFSTLVPDNARVEELSMLVAFVLLLSYAAYLVFVLRGAGPFFATSGRSTEPPWFATAEGEGQVISQSATWGLRHGLLTLAGATVGTAIVSEALVDAVDPVTRQLGWTELFVGVILIPIVGNAAENWAAVRAAWHNHVDLTLGITAGSSTQIPLFVTPVLIFASLAIGQPMTLVFEPLELTVLALSTAIFAYVSLDGESHWLEGVLLLALYLMTAAVFFLDPVGTLP